MKNILFCLLLIFCGSHLLAQKTVVSGYVRDSITGESLLGANVSISVEGRGTTTNAYGYFAVQVTNEQYQLVISFVGYETKTITINGNNAAQLVVLLVPKAFTQDNVTVSARKKESNVKSAQMGKIELNINTIKQLPAIFGEVDILKTLQLLPGVRNAGEGNAGFYVRGGGPDQNLIILDDAVVYNPGHLFGFFSVFNADAIKSVSLIKGGMPAQYGGRLSSVVDITMKDGNLNKTQVDAGIGLIASRLSVQGPIKKQKSSYMLSLRRTYIDALVTPFIKPDNQFFGSGYFFYDANAKMNFILSEKDRIYVSGYFGRDVFTFNNAERSFSTRIPWGNSTGTVRWNHVYNKRLFSNVSLIYNDYNFEFQGRQNDFRIRLASGIRDLTAKVDFDYFATPEHKVKWGAQYTFHTFLPNSTSGTQDSTVFNPANTNRKFANEYAVYIQDDWDVSKKLKLNVGLRATAFQQVGRYKHTILDANGNIVDSVLYGRGQTVRTYGGLEPRVTARYQLPNNNSIKAAITRNLQYIHLVTNAGTTLPTDLWVPSTIRVRPQISWQYAAGYFQNFKDNMFEASVEVYYKTMDNQIEYREGYTQGLRDPELDFVFGRGWSYGAEFLVNKVKGRLTGWVGYTLSWTNRRFPDLNKGEVFPSRFDRRHDLSVVGNYALNSKWRLSGVFVYGTGNAISLPERFYFVGGVLTQETSRINAYRMRAYHRLDFSAIYTPQGKKKRKYEANWVFSIYNAYSRLNPFFYYFAQEGNPATGNIQVQGKQVSLFPIIPAVTYNIKF